MKRLVAPLALTAAVALVAVLILRLDQERQYRDLLAQGDRALGAGDTYDAVEAFSGALALRPSSMVAHYRRSEAYRAQRQDDSAVRDLREAIRLAPDAPEPLVAMGLFHDLRGEVAEAADWYGRAADRLQDTDPNLLYALALARYRSGSPGAAQAPLQRALAKTPTLPEAHYLLGLVYRDAHNIEAAVASLEQAVRLAPSLTPAREELADLYRELGRGVDEMMQLQALATLDDRVSRRVEIGLAESRRGQFDGAIGTLTTAARMAPDDSYVYLALGRVYLARAEHQSDHASVGRALTLLERALGGSVRRSEGLTLYGRALYLNNDAPAAERILREAIATSPADLSAFAYLADAAEALQHPLIARDALVNLDALEGDTARVDVRTRRARRIGALSLDGGDARGALEYLTQAITGGDEDPGTLGLLARAKWQTGDAEGARAALRRAVDRDARGGATNTDVQRLLRIIK